MKLFFSYDDGQHSDFSDLSAEGCPGVIWAAAIPLIKKLVQYMQIHMSSHSLGAEALSVVNTGSMLILTFDLEET